LEFIRKLATDSPLPAGGAAAAYTIGMAVGLLEKVVLLQILHHADKPDIERDLLTARKAIQQLRQEIEALVERDPNVYSRLADHLAANDSTAADRGFSELIDVGMALIGMSAGAMDWARQLAVLSTGRIKAHLMVACELIVGGINASDHLARVNIGQIADPSRKQRYLGRLEDLMRDCRRLYVQVREHV
jgi:formiminotetrahydrofolate cyclodeaminase